MAYEDYDRSGYNDPCEMNETKTRCDSHGYDNITEGYNGRDLCTVGVGLDMFGGLTNSQIKDSWAAAKEGRSN